IDREGFLSEEAAQQRQSISEAYRDALELARQLNLKAMEVLRSMKLDWDDEAKVIVASLMVRVVETYQGVVLLLERGMVAQARMLVRAEFEALFSLAAIAKQPSLLDSYVAQHYDSVIKAFKSAKRWKQKTLRGKLDTRTIDRLVTQNQAKLNASQAKPLKIWKWAKKAGLNDFYNVFYVENSSAVHSDMWALNDHVDGDAQGDMQIYFGPSDSGLYHALRSAATALISAIGFLGYAYNLKVEDTMQELRQRWERLDQAYYAEGANDET
ncbi:unnamed protein product, partial [marine sediment metagenome]